MKLGSHYETRFKTGPTSAINAKVRAMKSHWNISQRTHPIHPLDPKFMFWCVSYCLGAFGTVSSPYETRFKTVRTGAINTKVCVRKSRRNFWQWTHPIHPIGPKKSCLGVFRIFWVPLGPFHRLMKLGSKRAELVRLMQKFVPRSRVGILATNASDPHHWTLNSCFGVFHRVWVHLAPFCHLTKLGSKWAELLKSMQKFVLRIRIGIFHNERTWSTTLDAKLLFGSISSPYETRFNMAPTGTINAKVHATKFFCNECTRSTPLDPKLMLLCVSFCLGAFGIVSLPYETRFKTSRTGAINAKVHATKSC